MFENDDLTRCACLLVCRLFSLLSRLPSRVKGDSNQTLYTAQCIDHTWQCVRVPKSAACVCEVGFGYRKLASGLYVCSTAADYSNNAIPWFVVLTFNVCLGSVCLSTLLYAYYRRRREQQAEQAEAYARLDMSSSTGNVVPPWARDRLTSTVSTGSAAKPYRVVEFGEPGRLGAEQQPSALALRDDAVLLDEESTVALLEDDAADSHQSDRVPLIASNSSAQRALDS